LVFPVAAWKRRAMASSRVFLPDGPLDLETTCPRWFMLSNTTRRNRAEALPKRSVIGPPTTKAGSARVSPLQFDGHDLLRPAAVDFLAEKHFFPSGIRQWQGLCDSIR